MSELELIEIIKEMDAAGDRLEQTMYKIADLVCREDRQKLIEARECIGKARISVVGALQDLIRERIREKHER